MTYGYLYEVGGTDEVRQYVLQQDRVLIGRGADCDIQLADNTVSRHHALLTTVGGCQIRDLGGANVTKINGVTIARQPAVLADGDIIKIGACSFRYSAPNAQAGVTEHLDPACTAELATAAFSGTLANLVLSSSVDTLRAGADTDAALSVVLAHDDEPTLLVREAGRTQIFPLRQSPWTIGRGPKCEIRVGDAKASREHARLESTGDEFVLRDLSSANGTQVNGIPIHERRLTEDDTIRIGDAALVVRMGGVRSERDQNRAITGGRRIPVVLVPGLCGTELFKGQTRIWPNLLRSVSCSEEQLAEHWGELSVGRAVREKVVIPGLVKMEAFGRLVDFLCQELGYTEGKDLLEFAYDWRQDCRKSAALLKDRIATWRHNMADPHAKLIFIAHSMGGLICRYYLEHLGGVDVCARHIQLGTPNKGTTRIFSTILSGRNALALPIGATRIRRMMMHFSSVYQLLPAYPSVRLEDGTVVLPLGDDDWLPKDCRERLAEGRAFRETLATTDRNGVPTTCVFGYGQRTLVGLRVRRERDGSFRILDEVFDDAGDDSVMEASAVLDRAEIHPVRQRHGALHADRDVQRRLRYELLERPR